MGLVTLISLSTAAGADKIRIRARLAFDAVFIHFIRQYQ